MALSLKVPINELLTYPNIFLIEDLLVISVEKVQEEYIFYGISNSIYKARIETTETESEEATEKTMDIKIPSSNEEISKLIETSRFAIKLFSFSNNEIQLELANKLTDKLAKYDKIQNSLKLKSL